MTDMTMPHLTGAAFAGELAMLQLRLPGFFANGFDASIDAEKAKTLAIHGFFLNPVVLKEIVTMVGRVLDEVS